MPIYFGSNFAREPFQFDSVGNDWEQESVTRPEGYPLYHYLQTKEGVGEVTVYSRNQAVSDNILSNSHTIELQKGQGILIAPNVPQSMFFHGLKYSRLRMSITSQSSTR
jgi:AraC family transcriptional regulator, melibiose operon regulatory protein